MIQPEEQGGGTVGFRHASRRPEIRSNSVSTLKPWSRSSIICSRLNPACAPAMANFPIAATKFGGVANGKAFFGRESHGPPRAIRDLDHKRL
jgi:hypothetical protein